MAGKQTHKVLLRATSGDAKNPVSHIVAVFANKLDAAGFAAHLRNAHASGNKDNVLKLDPAAPADKDGKLLPIQKYTTQVLQYNPHMNLAGGLDDEEVAPAAESSK